MLRATRCDTITIPPKPLADRMKLAKERGDDVLLACIDEGYGTAVVRDMSVSDTVKSIRELEAKAKQGDEDARRDLKTMLLIWMPAELVGPGAQIEGFMRITGKDS